MRIVHPDHHLTISAARSGRRLEIRGTVQGVGFRPWVYRTARAAGVTGWVRNDTGGVTIEAFGAAAALDQFVDRLQRGVDRPAAAAIDALTERSIAFEPRPAFHIVDSEESAELHVSIPPDLATCPECLADVHDARNRRHGYAFTNCTNCGPRFTIATAAPYDRPNTTMAAFTMCPACRREYERVEDRRFHAQPNACPACGPSLQLRADDGRVIDTTDVIRAAAAAITDGLIVAIKGIGGFQLACDATSEAAVARLRERKRRDEKPFAVMVASLDAARALATMSADEEQLLASPERPIVLVSRRTDAPMAAGVAPRNPLVGVLVANSPLHTLLLEAADRPVVMTSGNLSDEPIAFTNEEALARLRGIADLFVVHDRAIVTRCDDSVARVIAAQPVVLRRARGYTPRPLRLSTRVDVPILGCGALLKNTFCLARGDEAVLGPHIGDLDNVDVYRAYTDSIDRLEAFLRICPEIAAHDLHPDYFSTHYAEQRRGVRAIAVQHHHAHVAAVMAEHGLEGPVLGLAYDGTGLGTDGTAWGSELLLATYTGFTRLATFRALPLAGGDAAIRQPWRIALAMLDDAFEGDAPLDAFDLFAQVPSGDLTVARQMIQRRLNTPSAHGAGRYFDAFGALLLGRGRAAYEGQIAFELNMAADSEERRRYRFDIDSSAAPSLIDFRSAVRDAVFEAIGGAPVPLIAARVHNTIAAASVEVVRAAARDHGRLPVALSGGCFQNARLTESIVAGLAPEFRVHLHRRVPPGDGGIALGQALVANAMARSGSCA